MNRDHEKRDELLGITDARDVGGTKHFEGLSLVKLKEMLELGFIKADEAQNESPTTKEFLDFMILYPKCTAHGYVVVIQREDYRMTVEGLQLDGPVDDSMQLAFLKTFREADDCQVSEEGCFCWYD